MPGQPPVFVQPRQDNTAPDDGDDGNDELIAPEATEKTAVRKPDEEPERRADSPTG